jgi:acyl carrier protein
MTPPRDTRPDPVELRAWLTERISEYLRLPVAEIDPAEQLAAYGLESVYALALCGDIEDHLGMVLDATIVWDHPTIDQLGDHLDRLRDQPGAG